MVSLESKKIANLVFLTFFFFHKIGQVYSTTYNTKDDINIVQQWPS